MQAFADALAEHVEGGVGFHYFVHGLQDEGADAWEPVAERGVHVVGEVDGD